MKKAKKVIALCCAGAMAICFASCQADADADATTTTNTPVSENQTAEATDSATETATDGATAATDAAPSALPKPADKGAAVKMFNDALAKKAAVNATITRKVDSAKVLMVDLMDRGVPENFDLTDAALEGADLHELADANVASMQCKEEGDNYIITFTMNQAEGNGDATVGYGGFQYFFDCDTTVDIITQMCRAIFKDDSITIGVKRETFKAALSDGTMVATVNKNTGALSAVTFSFAEGIKATGVLGDKSAKAEIKVHATVRYTVS